MTKSKRQLRAEAVERLRKLNCMDVDCYQLLEATVDDAGEKVGYRVEIRKLIELLTDEEPPDGDALNLMRNCSLYEIGKILHPADNTRSPLIALAEMVERDYVCREAYDDLRDEFVWTNAFLHRMGKKCGTKDVPSLVAYVEQLEAECDGWKSQAERHGDSQRSVLSADSDTDKGEDAKAAQDTRELLEAEIRYEYNGRIEWEADQIIGWLDRQAAITEHEVLCHPDERDEQIAELKADNDYLRNINEKLGREVRDWRGEAKNQRNNFYQATEARKHWQRKYENLKATSYSAEAPSDESELARELGKALAERDMYRDKLGRAIDAAHMIIRLKED